MNSALLSRKSDEWATPDALFAQLDEEFDFALDAAASHDNYKCAWYYTAEENALECDWQDPLGEVRELYPGTERAVWCNPPYSQLAKWIAKAASESQKGATVVMLIPSRTDTRAWHRYIWDAERHAPRPGVEVRFLPGRLKFGDAKNSAPFPSAVVVFRGQA